MTAGICRVILGFTIIFFSTLMTQTRAICGVMIGYVLVMYPILSLFNYKRVRMTSKITQVKLCEYYYCIAYLPI